MDLIRKKELRHEELPAGPDGSVLRGSFLHQKLQQTSGGSAQRTAGIPDQTDVTQWNFLHQRNGKQLFLFQSVGNQLFRYKGEPEVMHGNRRSAFAISIS